jgi:hypothetical protein
MVRVLNQAISDPQYAKEPNLEGALIALYKRAANNEAPADLGASRYQKDEDVRDTCRPHEGACG